MRISVSSETQYKPSSSSILGQELALRGECLPSWAIHGQSLSHFPASSNKQGNALGKTSTSLWLLPTLAAKAAFCGHILGGSWVALAPCWFQMRKNSWVGNQGQCCSKASSWAPCPPQIPGHSAIHWGEPHSEHENAPRRRLLSHLMWKIRRLVGRNFSPPFPYDFLSTFYVRPYDECVNVLYI